MPVYTYKCMRCEKITDFFNTIQNRKNCPVCTCGGTTEKIIVPTQVQPQMPEYTCLVSGEVVTSRKRRKEIMKEHNLIEKG